MPAAQLDFRASCGQFVAVFVNFMYKRALFKKEMRASILTLRSRKTGVLVGLALIFLFWGENLYLRRGQDVMLLRCGDVEANPGPGEKEAAPPTPGVTTRQTKLSVTSVPRSSKDQKEQKEAEQKEAEQPTMADLMAMLRGVKEEMTELKTTVQQEVAQLAQQHSALHGIVNNLKEEVSDLSRKNDKLERKNNELADKVNELDRKCDDLENRSKRNNVLFFGVPKATGETNENCEGVIQELLTDKMNITDVVNFDRVHRLTPKADSPIIARCTSFKQKVQILKAKQKLKGTNVFVGEDFSQRVREIRRKLTPHLKQARSDGKLARMVHDHLFIDGKKFVLGSGDFLREAR